jgi:hypothetical protein
MTKLKFKSAAEKRQYEENLRSWENLKAKYPPALVKRKKDTDWMYSLPVARNTEKLQSLVTPGGSTAAKQSMMYTGDKIKGIGTMHKSNMVPVFSNDEAKDLASMRR